MIRSFTPFQHSNTLNSYKASHPTQRMTDDVDLPEPIGDSLDEDDELVPAHNRSQSHKVSSKKRFTKNENRTSFKGFTPSSVRKGVIRTHGRPFSMCPYGEFGVDVTVHPGVVFVTHESSAVTLKRLIPPSMMANPPRRNSRPTQPQSMPASARSRSAKR